MLTTNFFKWTYPEENDDPHFDVLQGFFVQQDETVFGLTNTACNIIIPPPTVSWNPGTKVLSWDDDFEIPLMSIGFSLKVKYGPDGVSRTATFSDGDRMIVTVPRTASGSVTANFALVNGAMTIANGIYTVGFCRGSKFYANLPQVFT